MLSAYPVSITGWMDVGSVSKSQTEYIPLWVEGRRVKAGSFWVGWRDDQEHRAAAWQGSMDHMRKKQDQNYPLCLLLPFLGFSCL